MDMDIDVMFKPTLKTKVSIIISSSLALITLLLSVTIYYWSYYEFEHTFEDNIISKKMDKEYFDKGIKNEWILGVDAHSIDVVQAIHGDKVANEILKKAEKQVENSKVYREKINGKYLLYKIDIDFKSGEHIYKYSVVRDIYLENLHRIIIWISIFVIFIFIISNYLITKLLTKLNNNLNKSTNNLRQMHRNKAKNLKIDNNSDPSIKKLMLEINSLNDDLYKQKQLKDDILRYISHEMKTPIMIIESYADSIKKGIYPKGDLTSSLQTIDHQVHRMNDKINELLLATRGQINTNEEESNINFRLLVDKVLDDIKNLKPNLIIENKIAENLEIKGYYQSLYTVVENLLINACKHAMHKIIIGSKEKPDVYEIYFFNDGEIIDKKLIEHIFEPFVSTDASGHGLGLSICKKVMENQGDEIRVISKEKGVTFLLIFNKK